MKKLNSFIRNDSGDAVVEAAFLFPFIILVFFAFVWLTMYLPTHIALQRSVQMAAQVASAARSDTGYAYNSSNNTAGINFQFVDVSLKELYCGRTYEEESRYANAIVEKLSAQALYRGSFSGDGISATVDPNDSRYVLITAEQTLRLPFRIPFVETSDEIVISKSARAMIRDADEFIRNMDIVCDLVIKNSESVKKTLGDTANFLGAFNIIAGWFD